MNYGEILGKSLKIVWKHKILWVLGLVGMVVALIFMPFIFVPFFSSDFENLANQPWWGLVPFAIELLMFAVVFPVTCWMMAATDLGALRADVGAERLSFRELALDSRKFFWRVLGIMLIYQVIVTITMMGIMVLVVGVTAITMGIGMLCMFPAMIVMMPLMYLSVAFMEQSVVAVVADDLRLGAAIKQVWNLFRKHFWPLVLMTVILEFGMGIVMGMLMTPLYFPLFFLPFIMSDSSGAATYLIIIGSCMFGYFLVYAFLTSGLMAFMRSAWMVTYLRLTRPPVAPAEVSPIPVENEPVSN